jgi:hypothetical protein
MSAVLAEPLDLEHLSATICAELASGLSDGAGIRDKYNISQAQWDTLKRNPTFRKMLTEAYQDWHGDMNAGKRITKKAEIMLEDSLPVLYSIAHDQESPRQQKIDSIKQMAVLAGKTNSKGEAAQGAVGPSGAVINITVVTKAREEKLIIEGESTSSSPRLVAVPLPSGDDD